MHPLHPAGVIKIVGRTGPWPSGLGHSSSSDCHGLRLETQIPWEELGIRCKALRRIHWGWDLAISSFIQAWTAFFKWSSLSPRSSIRWLCGWVPFWIIEYIDKWSGGKPDDFTTVVRSSLSWSWWLQCLSSNTKAMQWYSRCRAAISMLWWTLVNPGELSGKMSRIVYISRNSHNPHCSTGKLVGIATGWHIIVTKSPAFQPFQPFI